ncbi:DUF3309 family protein [Maritalea porphyrae]|uniref:DUF3309 domain-containing protein n=1 Tax=Maritalea porphyrae TaxID=880732 RepID=A0ABQ5UPR0_9HYPH|nr:DUF3309 family protein [Maritalea porphyrae]GLQ15937.1 hypothetical protein GCM10007879_01860 [Maritalea porphyrae]
MGLTTLILILLIISVVGVAPAWPYARGWGYRPVSVLGLFLTIFLLLLLFGRI